MEFKWLMIAASVIAVSLSLAVISDNFAGADSRAKAVALCVESSKYDMRECARLK